MEMLARREGRLLLASRTTVAGVGEWKETQVLYEQRAASASEAARATVERFSQVSAKFAERPSLLRRTQVEEAAAQSERAARSLKVAERALGSLTFGGADCLGCRFCIEWGNEPRCEVTWWDVASRTWLHVEGETKGTSAKRPIVWKGTGKRKWLRVWAEAARFAWMEDDDDDDEEEEAAAAPEPRQRDLCLWSMPYRRESLTRWWVLWAEWSRRVPYEVWAAAWTRAQCSEAFGLGAAATGMCALMPLWRELGLHFAPSGTGPQAMLRMQRQVQSVERVLLSTLHMARSGLLYLSPNAPPGTRALASRLGVNLNELIDVPASPPGGDRGGLLPPWEVEEGGGRSGTVLGLPWKRGLKRLRPSEDDGSDELDDILPSPRRQRVYRPCNIAEGSAAKFFAAARAASERAARGHGTVGGGS